MRELDFNTTGYPHKGLVKVGSQMIVKNRLGTSQAVFNEETWEWESGDKAFVKRLSMTKPGTGIAIPRAHFPMTHVSGEKTLVNVFMKVLVLASTVTIIEIPEVVANFIAKRREVFEKDR